MTAFDPKKFPKEMFSRLHCTVLPKVQQVSKKVKPIEKLALGGSFVLATLPKDIQASALAPILNSALSELIDSGEFDFLEGHCCAIALRERNLSWHIGFDGAKLLVVPDKVADVTISATVPAFLSLISQSADPDTLFFQRHLSIEGDVEMGLYVKNLLDALDQDDLPPIWRKALAQLKQLIEFESDAS